MNRGDLDPKWHEVPMESRPLPLPPNSTECTVRRVSCHNLVPCLCHPTHPTIQTVSRPTTPNYNEGAHILNQDGDGVAVREPWSKSQAKHCQQSLPTCESLSEKLLRITVTNRCGWVGSRGDLDPKWHKVPRSPYPPFLPTVVRGGGRENKHRVHSATC